MASKSGHTVLRLPLYHCDLNPIELACANNVALHNVSYKMKEVEQLLNNYKQNYGRKLEKLCWAREES